VAALDAKRHVAHVDVEQARELGRDPMVAETIGEAFVNRLGRLCRDHAHPPVAFDERRAVVAQPLPDRRRAHRADAVGGQAPVAQRRQQVTPLLLARDDGNDRQPIDQGRYQAGENLWMVGEKLVNADQDRRLPLKVGGRAGPGGH
jgi:hypothetical protein